MYLCNIVAFLFKWIRSSRVDAGIIEQECVLTFEELVLWSLAPERFSDSYAQFSSVSDESDATSSLPSMSLAKHQVFLSESDMLASRRSGWILSARCRMEW